MQNESPYSLISPLDVQNAVESGAPVRLVDVRTPVEYQTYHIADAILIPLNEFAERYETELDPEDEIILICEHGVRSETAARYLASENYPNVSTMVGGMSAYDGEVVSGFE